MAQLTRQRIKEIVREEVQRRAGLLTEGSRLIKKMRLLQAHPESVKKKAAAEHLCSILPIVCCVQEIFTSAEWDIPRTEDMIVHADEYEFGDDDYDDVDDYDSDDEVSSLDVVYEIVAGDNPDEWYESGVTSSMDDDDVMAAAQCSSWEEIAEKCPHVAAQVEDGIVYGNWEVKPDFEADLSGI